MCVFLPVPFEDNRVRKEDWPAMKEKVATPFGQLPYLEVDGQQIGQSAAFTRLLAKRFGLAGKDDIEQALVDAIVDFQKGKKTEFRTNSERIPNEFRATWENKVNFL